ncbi:MAG TPA: hypothetical protein GXZ82_09760 [Firmicutes bacterium]|jgi:membrane protein implicated in regulation of membrane protease activity|nr:hypothetical protein [Bacillota bacterium]
MNSVPVVVLSILTGTWARIYLLRIDYRIYPSYPQGYVIHVMLGAIAAFLGAVAVPAIISKDYQAATFLALAATQFREIRTLERETLSNMEATELVPRGKAYIEGIARVFEARNYLALLTALLTSLTAYLTPGATAVKFGCALIFGALLPVLIRPVVQGQVIGDVADVEIAPIEFDGPMLIVADVRIMNIGLETVRQVYRKQGLGVIIKPRNPNATATLANVGQRQAIAHDAAGQLGIHKDIDEPDYTPLVRRQISTGCVVMAIVPSEPQPEALLTAVRNVPILEGARKKPLASRAGRLVD